MSLLSLIDTDAKSRRIWENSWDFGESLNPVRNQNCFHRDLWQTYYVPGIVKSRLLSCLQVYCRRKKPFLFGNWLDWAQPAYVSDNIVHFNSIHKSTRVCIDRVSGSRQNWSKILISIKLLSSSFLIWKTEIISRTRVSKLLSRHRTISV